MFDSLLMIDDKAAKASDGATFDRLDPISAEVATRAAAAVADVVAACNAAAAAFAGWAATPPSERRALLNKAADLLVERTPDFVTAMTV